MTWQTVTPKEMMRHLPEKFGGSLKDTPGTLVIMRPRQAKPQTHDEMMKEHYLLMALSVLSLLECEDDDL